VGIVAHDAFLLGIMLSGVDAGDFRPGAVLVGEIGMAADTEPAATVNGKTQRILGVVIIWAVAVFTADGAMGGVLDVVILVLVAFPADRGGLVFDRVLLPFGLVGLAVPAIHVTALIDAEVTRY
jgi:hypothetical protein